MKKIFLIIAFILIYCSPAWATTKTVCDSGCDHTTIAAALTAVGNGTHTITVQGTYTGLENITISNSGTDASNRLRIIASGTQTVKAFMVNGSYLSIEGFTFDKLTGNDCNISLSDAAGAGISYITVKDGKFTSTADGIKSNPDLYFGSTKSNVYHAAFDYMFSGTLYTKAENAVGVVPGNDVIPSGKYGAVAFEIAADETIDVIEATNNATGYDSAALAEAGLPAVQASHARFGFVTVMKSDGNFTFGTTNFDATNVTATFYKRFDYPAPICSKDLAGNQSDPVPDHILIDNNDFDGFNYNSTISGTNYVVSNNLFHDNVGGCDVFYVCGDGITISGNEVYNISEVGSNHVDFIQTAGTVCGAVKSQNVVVERNYVHDLDGAQWANLSTDSTANIGNWTFRNNIFSNIAYSANIGIVNVTIANNTFYKVANELSWTFQGMCPGGTTWDATGMVVKNNIFINKTASNIGWYVIDAGCSVTPDYNYVADEDDYGEKTGFSETHGVNGGNPYLSNIAAGTAAGYALTAQSTILIGTGADLSAIFTDDYAGGTRTVPWDIGAYEYQSGATTPNHSFSGGATHSFGAGSTATWQ